MALVVSAARLGAVLLGGILVACSTALPDSNASGQASPSLPASSVGASPGPSDEPSATPTLASPSPAIEIAPLESPFDGAAILEAMRASRRPGGVPDQLETPAIADAIAAGIQTIGGDPWATIAIGGSCGPQSCGVEVAGAPSESTGEDLYIFSVDTGSGHVELVDATLAGLAPELVTELDALARATAPDRLKDVVLASARRVVSEPDRFVLSYRSGGEEGSPRLDVLLDAASGAVRPADG